MKKKNEIIFASSINITSPIGQTLKEIEEDMNEFFEEMDAKIAELKKGNN